MNSTCARSPGTVSGVLAEKRRIRYLFWSPLQLHNLGAVGERLAIAGYALLIGFDHYRIAEDRSGHVCAFGEAGADQLPFFVPLDLREREAAWHLQRVLVLFVLR
jgi:hypothetical protein